MFLISPTVRSTRTCTRLYIKSCAIRSAQWHAIKSVAHQMRFFVKKKTALDRNRIMIIVRDKEEREETAVMTNARRLSAKCTSK